MDHKKKYPFGHVTLFCILSLLLLNIFSTCYANTSLSDDQVEYIINNSFTYDSSERKNVNFWFNSDPGTLLNQQISLSNFYTAFKNAFNSSNTVNFSYNYSDFFGYFASYGSGSTRTIRFYYGQANFGINDNQSHVLFLFNNSSSPSTGVYNLSIRFIDDNKNVVSIPLYCLEFIYTLSSDNFTFNRFYTTSSLTNTNKNDLQLRTILNWNVENINTSILQNISGFINFLDTQAVYSNYDGVNFYNNYIVKLLDSGYVSSNPSDPSNPSEPGNTGTITNSSGEITGQIDLTNIEQGIDNIQNQISGDSQRIIDNQNQNTQAITNSIDNIGNFLNEENTKESGEIAEALDVGIEVEDPTADFFTWFFEQLKQCFTISTAQYLHFSILENEFTINSDDYIINIPILRNVLGIGSGIFILYGIFKDLRKEIEKVKEGKFEEIANEDITANMM